MSSNEVTEGMRSGKGYHKKNHKGGEEMAKEESFRDDDTVAKVLKNTTFGPWEEVGISEETMRRFGVRVKYSPNSGPFGSLEAIYFPAYNKDLTKIVGFQKKNLLLDKNAEYHFTNIGTVSVKNPMFFQNLASPTANNVIISEGPKDSLCIYEAIKQNTDPKWHDRIPPIVSLLLGTPNGKANIMHNEDFIRQYSGEYEQKGEKKKRGPILAFDNDYAEPGSKDTKGKECTEEVASFLRDSYVRVLNHPSYINDCGDYLKLGKTELLYKLLIFESQEYRPEKIVSLYDAFKPGELILPIEKGIYLPSYPKLMEKLMGERDGELTLYLATSGAGKSTITADMLYETMEIQGKCGGIFLEENLKKTFQRFIARKMKVNLKDFRLGLCNINKEEYEAAEKWVADPDRFIALNHSGGIKISQLESLAKLMIYKYDRKKIVFDHLTLSQPDSKGADQERLGLDQSMKMLAALCEETNASIKVICHVNRSTQAGRNRDIKEPTWRRCFKEDARGSSSIECLSWNVICIDLEELPSGARGRVRLSVQKNREASNLGFADILIQDEKTGVMIDASDYVYDEKLGMVPRVSVSCGY